MNQSNFAINKTKIFFKMKSFIILFFLNFLFIHTIFSDLTWQLPAQDISSTSEDTDEYDIATNASGSNVYFVWETTFITEIIQTATSNDFGVTWNPFISISSVEGTFPKIVTDHSGKFVYIAYQFDPGGNQFRVLFSRSIDSGQTYTLGASQKTLSDPVSSGPEITTNANGQYVYVIWLTDAPNTVEFVRSSDFGENWPAPASAIPLSDTTTLSADNKIATSDSGQYVSVLWAGAKSPATIRQVQTSRSQDFGQTWTAFIDIPKLSDDDFSVISTDLKMSSSGQYIYAIWDKSIGGGTTAVQFSRSDDFGATWTIGLNLSSTAAAVVARDPRITTDKTGKYVYVIWRQSGALGISIQIRRSTDFGKTWEPVIISRTGSLNAPRIVTDDIGRYVYTIWQESFEVFSSLSFNFGISFTSPLQISSQTDSSFNDPVLTMASSGIYAYAGFDRSPFFIIAQAVRGVDIPRTDKRFKFKKP